MLSLPVLMFLYPMAITLILLSILTPVINKSREIYRWTVILTVIAAFFDFCNALPARLKEVTVISRLIQFAVKFLPGFEYGFGWIVPSVCGFLIAIVICRLKKSVSFREESVVKRLVKH